MCFVYHWKATFGDVRCLLLKLFSRIDSSSQVVSQRQGSLNASRIPIKGYIPLLLRLDSRCCLEHCRICPDGTGHNHVDGPYFSNFAATGLEPHVDSRLGKRWCRSIFGPISSGGLDNRPVRRTTRFGCQFIGLGGSNAFVGLGYYPVDLLYSFCFG